MRDLIQKAMFKWPVGGFDDGHDVCDMSSGGDSPDVYQNHRTGTRSGEDYISKSSNERVMTEC